MTDRGFDSFRAWIERQPVECSACRAEVPEMRRSNVLRRVQGAGLVVEFYCPGCSPSPPAGVLDGWGPYDQWPD